jgi:hypothetical protein
VTSVTDVSRFLICLVICFATHYGIPLSRASKAELARRVGRNPASIRRLFTAEQARPELPLIISIANALDASIEIKRCPGRSSGKRATVQA